MYFFGLATFISLFSGFVWPTLFATKVLGALFLYSLLMYFYPCLKLTPRRHFFTWARIRHATNWAFMKGALDGTKKFGTICLEPSW
jgi:hypothetical protein